MRLGKSRVGMSQYGNTKSLFLLLGIAILCSSLFVDWVYVLSSIGWPEKKLHGQRGQIALATLQSLSLIIAAILIASNIIFWKYPNATLKLFQKIEFIVVRLEKSPILTALSLLIVVLTKTVLQLSLYLVGYRHYAGDDFARAVKADYWLQPFQNYHDFGFEGWLSHGSFWLPFPDYLFGLALAINRDLFITPKIMNLGLSGLAVVVLYALGRVLFGRVAGLGTAIVFAFLPWHVWLGLSGMTSDLFSTVMTPIGGLALIHWLRKGRPQTLLIAAGCLFVANGIRYENWFFSVVFSCFIGITEIIGWRRQNRPPQPVFLLIGALMMATVFPITHMTISYLSLGEWLPAIHATDSFRVSVPKINMLSLALISFPFEILISMTGIVYALRSQNLRSYRDYLLLVSATFLLFAVVFKMQLPIYGAKPARNLLPYIVLLLPYGGLLIARLLQAAGRGQSQGALVAVCVLVLVMGTWDIRIAFQYPNPRMADAFYTGQTLDMLNALKQPPGRSQILIEKGPRGHIPFSIVVLEGNPERFVSLGGKGGSAACAEGFQSKACKAYLLTGQFDLVILLSQRLVQSFQEAFGKPTWQIGKYHIFTLPQALKPMIP